MNFRPRLALAIMLGGCAWLAVSTAVAQAPVDRPTISKISLVEAGGTDAVKLVIQTEDGRPVPADAIGLKFRDNVVRVTFMGIPLATELGMKVPLGVSSVRHVTKGYALKEHNGQSFVRLKFDTSAQGAFDGWNIEPIRGGSVLHVPLANAPIVEAIQPSFTDVPAAPVLAGQSVVSVAANAGTDTGTQSAPPKGAGADSGQPGQTAAPDGEPGPKADPGKKAGLFDWAGRARKEEPGQPVASPSEKPEADAPTEADGEEAAVATPIETLDSARGPSMGRVAGGLAVVVLLILALAFCAKKMRGIKGVMAASWRPPVDSVKVLSTHKVSKGHDVLILDVLGEYLVVGQSAHGMSLLGRVPAAKVQAITAPQVAPSTATSGSWLSRLMGSGAPNRMSGFEPSLPESTIAGLTREIEAGHSLAPDTGTNLRTIRPSEPAAASTDVDPPAFERLIQRRLEKAQERLASNPARQDPELESVAVSIRDRARSLGRL